MPTRIERLQRALRGDPTDRPPWSLWRHFYHREDSAQALAASMLEWAGSYGFDFLKVNPRAHYHAASAGRWARPARCPRPRETRISARPGGRSARCSAMDCRSSAAVTT